MNVDLVFFPEYLNERAPHMIQGSLAFTSGEGWTDLRGVVDALRNGEPVNIRQASATEIQRAEECVALYEIGMQLAQKVCMILDDKPEQATAAVTALRDTFETSPAFGAYKVPTNLIDCPHVGQGQE